MVQISNVVLAEKFISNNHENSVFNIINRINFKIIPAKARFFIVTGVFDLVITDKYYLHITVTHEEETIFEHKAEISLRANKIKGKAAGFLAVNAHLQFRQAGVYSVEARVENNNDDADNDTHKTFFIVSSSEG